jgi:signal transduction histidine kinase/DNA-binding NarL/FixJ family response regulator
VNPNAAPGAAKKPVSENFDTGSGCQRDFDFFFSEIITKLDNAKFLKNLSELDRWLPQTLPILGIESAFILLYSETSYCVVRHIAGYDRINQNLGDSVRLLPLDSVFIDMLSGNGRRSYCITPLLHEDELYGLLAMEMNPFVPFEYETLSTQIGNSIKSIKLIEEVSDMNAKLKEANEQKSQFFINIAHETKTPLTLIQNYLERILKRPGSDPDLAIVKQNFDILLENMLNFLDAERLEKGTMSFSHDSLIDLSEFAKKKCALFEPLAAKKNIAFNLHTEDCTIVKIDPGAIDRVLNNLLDNAVKYSHKGGKVSVEVTRSAGKAVLRVSDNGPGLSAETIAHMFEPYYQLSMKRTSRQGIGVGLSIVKKIIDDLGASIAVTKNKSGGACFTIEMDACKEVEVVGCAMPLAAPSAGIVFDDDIVEEEIVAGKPSILIVDDNIRMLDFLKGSFKKTYNVFLATNVPAALAKIESIGRPELIVSDIMMDGMDGHSFLAVLARNEDYCDIPFIFLTAASGKDEEFRGLAGGAIDYIRKPFSITELSKKIESIVALRGKMKKREVMKIRNKIDGLLLDMEDNQSRKPAVTFDSLCIEYGFSAREKEILKLLLDGLLNKEIAARLNVSQRAVEYRITNVFKKAGIRNKYDLIAKFR